MSHSTVQTKVRDLIAIVAGIEPSFSAEADVFRDLGVESAAALDLLLRLEEEFNVAIDDELFARTRTLSTMSALISNLQGGTA
jgi:acyl carrier protein